MYFSIPRGKNTTIWRHVTENNDTAAKAQDPCGGFNEKGYIKP
jgi:hypothetical protein